jgi:hypothetical protein
MQDADEAGPVWAAKTQYFSPVIEFSARELKTVASLNQAGATLSGLRIG